MTFVPHKPIAFWLYISAFSVFLMAIIGAITRLTESGLSIVEWNPITGTIPPLGAESWQREFDLYRESPQYLQVNRGMTLDEFKNIYFWEWLHRLWGRMIGLIYFIPLVYFWAKKEIPKDAKKPLLIILALGFLQGLMGWLMVKSGLVDRPSVSHYRLAAHLGLAFVIYAALLRMAFSFSIPPRPEAKKILPLRPFLLFLICLFALTMIFGAFVAGLRAGWVYNTFPMMGDRLWPSEMFDLSPLWLNFFENHATVQFIHRLLGVATFVAVTAFALIGIRRAPLLKPAFEGLIIMASVQAVLGIVTLITKVQIAFATLHQAGAMILLFLLMLMLHHLPKEKQT